MSSLEVLALTKDLISRPSVTPEDHGCQDLIADFLNELGFEIHHMPCNEVRNLWAIYKGTKDTNSPCLVFAGHTDVVPTGPNTLWETEPFEPVIKDNKLYGRGAADMKGSLAAMLIGVKNFITHNTGNINGSIAFLITSDEEGPALYGTRHVVEQLQKHKQKVDYCIVGEPSSTDYLGDIIKNGRRGSLSGHLTLYGTQGHAAYPHKAKNAINMSLPILQELTSIKWDDGNADFPPTTFQLINIQAGTGATNVIPGALEIEFNFRFASCNTFDSLIERVENMLNNTDISYDIDWKRYASPFLTEHGEFTNIVQSAIKKVTNNQCTLATTGGTSDGRFIFPAFGCDLIELGPLNHCIHHANEHVNIQDLETLTVIHQEILSSLFL